MFMNDTLLILQDILAYVKILENETSIMLIQDKSLLCGGGEWEIILPCRPWWPGSCHPIAPAFCVLGLYA